MPNKVVIFLGAGFSVPLGLPAMGSFLSFADSTDRISDDDRTFLAKLLLQARGANTFLESSPTNLEDILTFAQMAERLGLVEAAADGETQSTRLRQIIRKIYTCVGDVDNFWNVFATFETFLGIRIHDIRNRLQIITTNYDLNAECALLRARCKSNPGFPISRVTVDRLPDSGLYAPDGIPIHKLHGSVNWFPADDPTQLLVEDRVVRVRGNERFDVDIPRVCASDYAPPGVPAIIPPSFLKPDLDSSLSRVWANAASALASAHTVVFVGYSFPPSDREMMYLLATAFSKNPSLRAVRIVDPAADAIVARLRSPASRLGSHFKELLASVNAPWEGATLRV